MLGEQNPAPCTTAGTPLQSCTGIRLDQECPALRATLPLRYGQSCEVVPKGEGACPQLPLPLSREKTEGPPVTVTFLQFGHTQLALPEGLGAASLCLESLTLAGHVLTLTLTLLVSKTATRL